MKRVILLLLLSMSLSGHCLAGVSWTGTAEEGISASITLSATDLSLADTLNVEVDMIYPDSYHPHIAELRHHLLTFGGLNEPPFTLLKQVVDPPIKSAPQNDKQMMQQKVTFSLTPQLPGKHALSMRTISFLPNAEDSTNPIEIVSDIFEIYVTVPDTVFQPKILIAPVRPLSQELPVTLSFSNRRNYLDNAEVTTSQVLQSLAFFRGKAIPWHIIPIVLVILIVLILIKVPLSVKKPEKITLPPSSLRDQALKQLKALSAQHLPEKGLFDKYFTEIDHLMRSFIEEKYHINASTLTTQEFLKKASETSLMNENIRSKLIDFMRTADKVKFANYTPTIQECEDILQAANKFIQVRNTDFRLM